VSGTTSEVGNFYLSIQERTFSGNSYSNLLNTRSAKPYCNSLGACVSCMTGMAPHGTGDAFCRNLGFEICDVSGRCGFCPSSTYWDGTSSCVGCTSNSHCAATPATPHCHISNHQCTECIVDADCGSGSNNHCDASGSCAIGCASDATCGAPHPHCDTSTSSCFECVVDGHCTAG
jgi:hypothetical protein